LGQPGNSSWRRRRAALLCLLAAISAPCGLGAQPQHADHASAIPPAALLERRVPIRTGIGVSHDRITTTSRIAQAFYDQGLAYLHDYVWIEAARSFHQALRADSSLALAHVGLTFAYAELGLPTEAHAALVRAQSLAAGAAAHDRRHVELRALQMAAEDGPRDFGKLTAYRQALAAATAAFPDDVELWLLRGTAESPDPADRGQGATGSSIQFFDKALGVAPHDFAAHHYLTHAYENTNRIDDALKHATAYAKLAPVVPHARHMRGHDLRRAGRIDDAIAEFHAADDLETAYFKAENVAPEYDWHYEHNLDLLATSYQYLGQMRKAEAVFVRAFALPTSLAVQVFNKREWIEFLIGRGRIEEALAASRTLTTLPSPLIVATGHIESGRAFLASKRYQLAAAESNVALAALRSATAGQALVAPTLQELQGEFLLRTGEREKGRASLTALAATVRALPGPDNWSQALFTLEAIGQAARESNDWELAATIARAMRDHDPAYAGTHYALGLVARHAGDTATAAKEFALARKYWSTADRGLPELAELKGASDETGTLRRGGRGARQLGHLRAVESGRDRQVDAQRRDVWRERNPDGHAEAGRRKADWALFFDQPR
jgi:tetratricopeptide (TPR) repeat protein